jgi:transcriptional regulator with XRE-family HTH domain
MPARPTDTDPRLRRLGDVIARRRIVAGISQETLAAAAGLTERHLRTVERGRAAPSYVSLLGLAEALGVPLDQLVREAL